MEDYLYAYSDLRPPSPTQARSPSPPLLAAAPKIIHAPPKAYVHRRTRSFHEQGHVKVSLAREATAWEALDNDDLSSQDDLDDGDAFEDLQDLQLKQVKATSLARLASCRAVLDQAGVVLSLLARLKGGFDAVAAQTHDLQTRCDALEADEAHLAGLADSVKETLQPFAYLPTATRLLNVPGSDLVLQPVYHELLDRVDAALIFLEQHPDYLDAEVYTRSYRQCMTKALTLIRVHFNNALRQVAADVQSKLTSNGFNKNTHAALLYTKFRGLASTMAPLLLRLNQACRDHVEYESLLNDCLAAYCTTRKTLLSSTITTTFKELGLITEFDAFATSAVSFLRILAGDEQALFHAFFSTSGGGALAAYQAGLATAFTDALSPRIAAETSLTRLCEVCASLQTQNHPNTLDHSDEKSSAPLFATTLVELENRIAVLARSAIAKTITGYTPTDADLDYHGKLVRRHRHRPILPPRSASGTPSLAPSTSVSVFDDSETVQSGRQGSSADWYITLRTSIALLSKVYRLVQSSLFDALAHEVVRGCLSSLLAASMAMRRKNGTYGLLFFIKHLLLLRDQLAGFELEHVPGSQDQAAQSSTAAEGVHGDAGVSLWDAATRGDLFSASGLYQFASSGLARLAAGALSRPVENMQDARLELQDQLQLAVNQLTTLTADGITQPLRSCMGNKQTAPDQLLEAHRKFRAGLPDAFTLYREALGLYLDEEQESVGRVLLELAQDQVLETYERFDSYLRLGKLHASIPAEQAMPSVLKTAAWIREVSEAVPQVRT